MRYLLRLAGLAIILWLHHPLLASQMTSTSGKTCTTRDGNPPNVHFGPADASRSNCRAKIKIADE